MHIGSKAKLLMLAVSAMTVVDGWAAIAVAHTTQAPPSESADTVELEILSDEISAADTNPRLRVKVVDSPSTANAGIHLRAQPIALSRASR